MELTDLKVLLKARRPGDWHVHTMMNVEGGGPWGLVSCKRVCKPIFWHFVRHRSVQLFLVPSGHTMLQIGLHTQTQSARKYVHLIGISCIDHTNGYFT